MIRDRWLLATAGAYALAVIGYSIWRMARAADRGVGETLGQAHRDRDAEKGYTDG